MVVEKLVSHMKKIKFNSYFIPQPGLKTKCVEQHLKCRREHKIISLRPKGEERVCK